MVLYLAAFVATMPKVFEGMLKIRIGYVSFLITDQRENRRAISLMVCYLISSFQIRLNLNFNLPMTLLSVIFRWIIEAMKQRLASRGLGVSSDFVEASTFLSVMLPPKVCCVRVVK